MGKDDSTKIRIRMYRQGLGDCFLLTLLQKGKEDFNIMIDCGLLVGTANGPAIMQSVAASIRDSLPKRDVAGEKDVPYLDVVVMTHEHADHISGFTQADAIFDTMAFGEVWAAWVDDEHHPKYRAVRERFHKQVTGVKAALTQLSPAQQGLKDTVEGLMKDFFDDDILGAAATKTGRSPAWDYVMNKAANKRFFTPGSLVNLPSVEGIRIYVLGPSEEFETFTKVNPPADETYRSKGTNFAITDSFFAAVADGSDLFDAELYQPFEPHLRIDATVDAPSDQFFISNYGFDPEPYERWRRINDDWLTTVGGLALNLDSYTNNTCLALAFEFIDSGKVLLFPGDAQFSNWISWQNLSWKVDDKKGNEKEIKTEHLLNRTVLYKVGHHGSHNATLKTHGLEMMNSPDLAAMIPVSREKAKTKKWEMPEAILFERLNSRTRGRTVMADEGDTTQLADRCKDAKFVNDVKFGGSFVRNPAVSTDAEPIFVEVTISE